MNYYEYAPPIFRYILNPETTPWHMFTLIWSILLLIMIVTFFLSIFYRKKNPEKKIIHWVIRIIWWVAFYHFLIVDTYYLDYEYNQACPSAGIYINKQVEADGYAESSGAPYLYLDDWMQLKNLQFQTELPDIWEQIDKKDCEKTSYTGHLYKEKINIFKNKKNGLLTLEPYSLWKDKPIQYSGLKNGICMNGYLNKSQSRYFVIQEDRRRVGLGLWRHEDYIVDTETSQKIAYTTRFTSSYNVLSNITIGGFGELTKYCDKSDIKTSNVNSIKQYRETTLQSPIFKMINLTLIPSQYFHNNLIQTQE